MTTTHAGICRWTLGFGMALAMLAVAAPVYPESALATTLKQGSTTVTVSPAQIDLECGETTQVDILINDVEDLFGVDLKVSYDPNILEVVDADAVAPGVQVKPGDLPDPSGGQGLVQENIVDVATGTINYAAIRLAPAPAQSGSGIILSITFKGKAAGTSLIKLATVALADATALPIEATKTDGAAEVTCEGQTPATPVTPGTPATPATPATPTATRPAGGKVTPAPHGKPVYPIPGTGTGTSGTCYHVVRLGQTLYSIARTYGVTVSALAAANGIGNPNYIIAGQTLVIPGCGGTGQPPVPPAGQCFTYTIRPGDTLSSIAQAYGDTVSGLTVRNGIFNPHLIYAGQTITVCPGGGTGGPGKPTYPPGPGKPTYPPGTGKPTYPPGTGKPTYPGTGKPVATVYPPTGGTCATYHTVKPGETLYSISLAYGGVAVSAILSANGITNPNYIYAGQVLCIPSSTPK